MASEFAKCEELKRISETVKSIEIEGIEIGEMVVLCRFYSLEHERTVTKGDC